jgi:hypothetical protein
MRVNSDHVPTFCVLTSEMLGRRLPVEDTKGVIRNRKSKKNRQRNDQNKKYKETNNYLLHIYMYDLIDFFLQM